MNKMKRLNIPREHFQGINKNKKEITSKRRPI